MALAQVYSAVPNDVITAARWNNEFGNIYNNGTQVAFPVTTAVSFAGFTITLDAAGATTLSSSASQALSITPGAKSGTPNTTGKTLNTAAHTFTDTATAGSGTATAFAAVALQQPTLAAQNSSVACTDAATLYVAAAPANGTNVTITNPWAIWVDAGACRFDGAVTVTGTLSAQSASDTVIGLAEIATQAEVNAMTDTTRIVTSNHNKLILATMQASTSGTSIDFTSIPAGVRRITLMFSGVSTSGTSDLQIQIGDAGGIETSGYLGAGHTNAAAVTNYTSAFGLHAAGGLAAASILHGQAILTLMDSATNLWAFTSAHAYSNTNTTIGGMGSKALSAVLDRVRVTTVGGTDTFDAGNINILYER